MHDLISSAVIILFFLHCLQILSPLFFNYFPTQHLFLPAFKIFLLFFFPSLYLTLTLCSIFPHRQYDCFSKEHGLEAIYVMGLSDVTGEESLSPTSSAWKKKLLYKPHARSFHTPVHSFCTDMAQFFCFLTWENSLLVHLNVGVNVTRQSNVIQVTGL